MKEKYQYTIRNIGRFFWRDNRLSVESSAILLILGMSVVAAMTSSVFVSQRNIINILDQTVLYALMAFGLTFVLMSGSANLSIGAMIALNSVTFALLANEIGVWSIPLVLLLGFLEGCMAGGLFVVMRIPSFIATFAMKGIFVSAAIILCGGSPVVLSGDMIKAMKFLDKAIFGHVKWQYVLVLVVLLLFLFLQKCTAFGKHVLAIGDSPSAARHLGVNIDLNKILCYGLSGFSAAMGGIVLCSRNYSGDATVYNSYTLLIIAVVIIGGTSLAGGAGGVFNTLLGALTIAVVKNAMQIMGLNIYYHSVVIGIVMILSVAISLDKRRVLTVK